MAYYDALNGFLKTVDESQSANAIGILPEAPENCGHGKHKNYYQGVLSYNYKSGKNEKYLIIGYQNSITENQIKKILTLVNTNEERLKSKSTASTRGSGIDELFLHFGKKLTILTEHCTERYIIYEWNINNQIIKVKTAIKNRVEMDVNNGLNQLACVNSNNDAEEEDLNNKILFMKNKVKNACDKKNIPFPKMMYYILLRDVYQNSSNIEEICERSMIDNFSKKYHNLDVNLYHLKEEPENINITKIKTLDIVGEKIKQDCIRMEVKNYENSKDTLIRYVTNENQYFFAVVPNGAKRVRNIQRLCEEDGTLIKDLKPKWIKYINEWKNNQSFDPSFIVEYYGIRWDKIEKEYEKIYNNKIYAGIYVKLELMHTKGHMLLNSIPFSVGNYFRTSKDNAFKNIQHLGGKFFRCVITVKNKEECMNMMARRTESKLNETTGECIGAIHHVIHRQHYAKKWWKKNKLIIKDRNARTYVNANDVIDFLFKDDSRRERCERFFQKKEIKEDFDLSGNHQISENKQSNNINLRSKGNKKKKEECGTLYAKLYKTEELNEADSNEDETVYNVTYFIKIGTCSYSRRGQRANELDKKYKPYQCLGGVEINHLNGNDNINMEYCVKEYWNTYDEDYSRVIVNGQATDRANIYEYKHWIDFKNKLNKLDYLYHNEEERNMEKWLNTLKEN